MIVAIPMEPSDCFLSLKEITLVLTLKLLALLATLRVALLIPLRSENWLVEVELVLEEDLELDSLFVLLGGSRMFDLDLVFLFGTAYSCEGSGPGLWTILSVCEIKDFFFGDFCLAGGDKDIVG